MKRDLHLSIPKPCHEKWSSFKTTAHGGFCDSCQKEVIDFTKWDEERIRTYFTTRPLHACGRFRADQLKVYSFPHSPSARSTWLPLLMASIVTVLTSRQVLAQTKSARVTEQTQHPLKVGGVVVKQLAAVHITGVVQSAEDSATLPGVNVIVKGTAQGTSTDADGAFSITLENATGNEVLLFSFIGLTTVEHAVNPTQAVQTINVAMEADVTQLGGVVYIGGVHARWYSPRRWWWGVKELFR